MTAGLVAMKALDEAITTIPGPRLYGIDHRYVDSVVSGLSENVRAKALKNLATSGYLGGSDSASSQADDTFNW